MKKVYLFFSLFVCCFIASANAQYSGASQQDWANQSNQDYSYGSSGSECAPPEKPMNDCYCLYCRYVPKYYNKWHCDYVPQYSYKKCCRYVPQQF